jgi:hypothetical protein
MLKIHHLLLLVIYQEIEIVKLLVEMIYLLLELLNELMMELLMLENVE